MALDLVSIAQPHYIPGYGNAPLLSHLHTLSNFNLIITRMNIEAFNLYD